MVVLGSQPAVSAATPPRSAIGVWSRPTPKRGGGSSWRYVKVDVLFVCPDPCEALVLLAMVDQAPGLSGVTLWQVSNAPDALALSQRRRIDVVLFLGAAGDALTFAEDLRQDRPDLPQVVVATDADESIAVRAVKSGVQDFLLREELSGSLLLRALRYAVERHRLQLELRSLSLTDELTRLHNRRGCITLAQQLWKQAARQGKLIALFYMDVDGLKRINDTFGHAEGDATLTALGEVLRSTFRESDVVCRMGGDEFVAVAVDDEVDFVEVAQARLLLRCAEWNDAHPDRPSISVSVGVTMCDPAIGHTLDSCLTLADAELYKRKQQKRGDSQNGAVTTPTTAAFVEADPVPTGAPA
jgi:diguanylate cyclase (GGDEF)-like protein